MVDARSLLDNILRPDGPVASLWSLIQEGSIEVELSQDNKIGGVMVSRDAIVVNVCDINRIREIMLVLAGGSEEGNKGEKKSKKKEIRRADLIETLQETAGNLESMEKSLILQYNGEDVLRAGHGASSMTMGLFGFKNMEIVNLILLMKLGTAFLLG